jgi:hypothetical protein
MCLGLEACEVTELRPHGGHSKSAAKNRQTFVFKGAQGKAADIPSNFVYISQVCLHWLETCLVQVRLILPVLPEYKGK